MGPAGVYVARYGTDTKASLCPSGCASAGAVNDSRVFLSSWRDFSRKRPSRSREGCPPLSSKQMGSGCGVTFAQSVARPSRSPSISLPSDSDSLHEWAERSMTRIRSSQPSASGVQKDNRGSSRRKASPASQTIQTERSLDFLRTDKVALTERSQQFR